MLDGLLTALLNLTIGAAGAVGGLAIALSTRFGERLIGHKFDERLEAYKGGIQRELEQVKTRLAHFSDRNIRSNELEYDAITTAWAKLDAAYKATSGCIARFYEHPDFNRMDTARLERYFGSMDLPDETLSFIMNADDKNAAWARVEDQRLLNKASSAIFEVHQTLGTKGIFIPKELEDEFKAALDLCSKAWGFRKTEHSHGHFSGSAQASVDFFEKGPSTMEALKQRVRERILAAYPAT